VTPRADPSDTFVACLTPPGSAAIATLAVRGLHAWDVVRRLFRPRSGVPLPDQPESGAASGRFVLGRLGQELADDVVVALKRATPVPWVEVHCHGGREVVRLLTETFERHGVRACTWQQFERQTQVDPFAALAAIALAEAATVRTASILLDQYQGAFRQAVGAVQEALARSDAAAAQRLLDDLARSAAVGRHLTVPWRVVVAGAPNVGKSSLVNALAGFPRCVVAPTPGTTRDVVTTRIAVAGWPVEQADTAGLRQGAEALEGEGIGLAQRAVAAADLCLWLLDASAAPVWPTATAPNLRPIVNKVDLPAAWDLGQALGAVRVSARTGAGLDELCRSLAEWLVPEPPPPGAAIPFTPELCDRVVAAREHCSRGRLDEARRALRADGVG
jgi:tRNA modification GTPase